MRRISAGRSVSGFFRNCVSHSRCTAVPSQVRSGAMSPPCPLIMWQVKQRRSRMSCPALPGRLVLRLLDRGNPHGGRLGLRAVGLRQQRGGDGIDLLRRELELRHLQRRPEGARIADLRSHVARQAVLDAFDEDQLVERLAADAAQLRRKVFGLLDAVDLVATGAAVLHHQPLAVFDLLRRGGIEMHVGDEVGLRLRLQESGQCGHLVGVEAVVRHHGVGIVVIGVGHPILQPLRFRLRADARQFRPDVASDHHASSILHGMARRAEGLPVKRGACGRICCRLRVGLHRLDAAAPAACSAR